MKRYHQQILRRPPSSNRREPLLKPRPSFSEVAVLSVSTSVKGNQNRRKITSVHVAEAVGSTTAECVAVCCCCPCGILNLVVWILYKVPVSLCRKAWRRRRRRQLIKKGLLSSKGRKLSCGCEEWETKAAAAAATKDEMAVVVTWKKDELADRLEKEMWERFYNTGFWRSPSQREEIQKKVYE